MPEQTERRGSAAVSWLKSPKHAYEDRYRLLTRDIPLVANSGRGELFAVLDGIGSAPMGMRAAQSVADGLVRFYREASDIPETPQGLAGLLQNINQEIHDWGFIEGTNRPKGGCAGTIAWLQDSRLTICHAGDTVAMLIRPDQKPRQLTRIHEKDGGIDRYFGLGEHLIIDATSLDVEEEDLILLMSDGVTKAFGAAEAALIVENIFFKTGDISKAVEELATRSQTKGSSDDITVLAIEIEEE